MPETKSKKQQYKPFTPSVNNTTEHDTATMEQIMKWREEEYQRYLEKKETKEQ